MSARRTLGPPGLALLAPTTLLALLALLALGCGRPAASPRSHHEPAMPHATLLDHPVIAERYFYPRRVPFEGAFEVQVEGARLACFHLPAPPGAPTLVHFHGNGEVVADYRGDWAEEVSALGVGVFLAEYRGYGGSSGRVALGRMLDDVGPILDALRERLGVPEERLILYGRSVGSLFATEAAARAPRAAGLILESGVFDVHERLALRLRPSELGASEEELRRAIASRLDIGAKIAAFPGPLLVLHAREDQLVGFDHAERAYAASRSAQRRLVPLPRGGHNTVLAANWEGYLAALRAFLGEIGAGGA